MCKDSKVYMNLAELMLMGTDQTLAGRESDAKPSLLQTTSIRGLNEQFFGEERFY
jgi:hypothetical protein